VLLLGLGVTVKKLPPMVTSPESQKTFFHDLMRLCREDEGRRFMRAFIRKRLGDDMLFEVSEHYGSTVA
jgi:hypothetical protein